MVYGVSSRTPRATQRNLVSEKKKKERKERKEKKRKEKKRKEKKRKTKNCVGPRELATNHEELDWDSQ